MAKSKASFRCGSCDHEVAKWVGRCPACGDWGSVAEARPRATAGAVGAATLVLPSTPAMLLSQIDAVAAHAKPTGIGELDRVLGGGLVPGSVVLLSGEPGVGKSTLLLEVVQRWAQRSAEDRSLYVTGEESAGQVRLRADRTGSVTGDVYLAAETDLATVLGHVEQVRPTLLVVDSVQTMHAAGTDGVGGGVTQVKTVAAALTSLAKSTGVTVLLIGHVTKDGVVAGPRTLEHLVDVVLHFEGDRHSTLRMLRGVKNRFGTADEVGCFELHEEGISGVTDPSGLFLHHRDTTAPGTAVTVSMDGKRALVGEVQALIAPTNVPPAPRRAVSGLDFNRVSMVLAVLARYGGIDLHRFEVYTATVGGMRMTEPSSDLALALALASARRRRAAPARTVAIGEVGLAGEIRRVAGIARRVTEAERLGFTTALVPPGTGAIDTRMRVVETPDIATAIEFCALGKRSRSRDDAAEPG